MAGITPAGFEIKLYEDLIEEINAELKQLFGATLNTNTDSVIGVINAVWADRLRDLWELTAAVYASAYPDSATGMSLSHVSAITGTIRKGATRSRVLATVNLDGGTTIGPTEIASVTGDDTMKYRPETTVTNAGVDPANFDLWFEALSPEARTRANAGTLTVIETSVGGWNSITNALDSLPGSDPETDPQLYARRLAEIRLGGSATAASIRANVSALTGVTGVTPLEDLDARTIEVVVSGGDNETIAGTIFERKALGLETVGDISVVYEDIEGTEHTVKFSRPTEVEVHARIALVVDAATYVGDAAVKNVITDWSQTLTLGESVKIAQIIGVLVDLDGVIDVTAVGVGTTAPVGATANLALGVRELALFDTSRIVVVV